VCESSDFDFYAGGGDGFGGGRYGDKFVFSERVFVFNVRDECSSVFLFSIFTFFFIPKNKNKNRTGRARARAQAGRAPVRLWT
jgi:hypothetical protein